MHSLGKERGRSGRRGDREHGGRGRHRHTGHPDIGTWQRPRPTLSPFDPTGQMNPSAGRRAGESAREAPAQAREGSEATAFLPAQAECAALLTEQAEQQERGPR